MKKKAIFFYSFMFCFYLFWNLIVQPLHLDEIWNYGFAHNIYKGLVPYRDFNMIITPFYPFFLSLGFHLFGSHILIIHLEQAILFLFLISFLSKLVKENGMFLLLFLFFPISLTFPSYNFFLLFLFVYLIYLEKFQKSDYWIGFVLALGVLTKQSVGVCLLLPSLFYWKDKEKIRKRMIGFLGPVTIFVVYLVLTKSLTDFVNFCFLGLFDFALENNHHPYVGYLVFLLFLGVAIYLLKRNPKNVENYYCIAFLSIMFPLFGSYYMQIAFFGILLMIFLNFNVNLKISLNFFFFSILLGISTIILFHYPSKIIYPNDINHFEYKLIDAKTIKVTKELETFVRENKGREILYLNSNAYYIKLVNDLPINHFDLINAGNWGYHGSDRLFSEVLKHKDAIFVIDKSELELKQTDKRILDYILRNGTKIHSISVFDIYLLEED